MSNLSFELVPGAGRVISSRKRYFDSLPYSQEYYLEILLENANLYNIIKDGENAGYFYLTDDGCLLEYYIKPDLINAVDTIFGDILKNFAVKTALCKTFDAPLLNCCVTYTTDFRVIGVLFRDYQEKPFLRSLPPPSVRKGVPEDEARIIAVNEEVFDHPAEVMQYIQSGQIFLFELDYDLVGFGIFSPVYPGRIEHDIGILVTPQFRGMGYGQLIVNHLVHFCQKNGWKPSAGCAIENTASRRCLEKSGFTATHRLLEFYFPHQHSLNKKRKTT